MLTHCFNSSKPHFLLTRSYISLVALEDYLSYGQKSPHIEGLVEKGKSLTSQQFLLEL
jgi:hypothetical protein